MQWTIPGTLLEIPRQEAYQIEKIFASMFLTGDMSLGQITAMTGLEPYTVQNWVKRELLPPPDRKRYSQKQVCRILTIHMLKSVLPMERICSLMGYVNGQLDDERDDVIDDAQLYFLFVKLAARLKELYNEEQRDAVMEQVLSEYTPLIPDAKQRVEQALRIMLTAFLAAKIARAAETMLDTIL